MEECIVEDDQIHFLGWELLIEFSKSQHCSFADSLGIWSRFIDEWSFCNEFIQFVKFIISLEISKEIVSHQLFMFEAKCFAEFLLGAFV